MSPASLSSDQKVLRAAIRGDLRYLDKSGMPGAKHFSAVLKLHPAHLESQRPEWAGFREVEPLTDDGSALFLVGETLRTALMEGRGEAAEYFRSRQNADGGKSGFVRALLLQTELWLEPTEARARDCYKRLVLEERSLDRDTIARLLMLIAFRILESSGIDAASEFYVLAFRRATGDLKKAIGGVGGDFGQNEYIYFKRLTSPSVRYDDILDVVGSVSTKFVLDSAREKFRSPFTRTFGSGQSALPRELLAAQLQADWAGAYWVYKRVMLTMASVGLLDSRSQSETKAAIVNWIAGGGRDIERLLSSNEAIFDEDTAREFIQSDLLNGRRVSRTTWQKVCSQLWDVLPFDLAKDWIDSSHLELRWISSGDDETATQLHPDQESLQTFARLISYSPQLWVERFVSLSPEVRGAVCRRLVPADVEDVGRPASDVLVDALMDAIRSAESDPDASLTDAFLCLAAIRASSRDDDDDLKKFIVAAQPREASAVVALNFPDLANVALIEDLEEEVISRHVDEVQANQEGRWSSFGSSSSKQIAQAAMALGRVTPRGLEAVEATLASAYSSATDVIDACQALVWLLDEGVTGIRTPPTELIRDRSDLSIVDRSWTGRDDLRAMNAALAGLRLRVSQDRRSQIDQLAFAVRDPDVQVRLIALNQFETKRVDLHEDSDAVLDNLLLGAVFDPDSRVVALAARLTSQITQKSLVELAWARLADQYAAAHIRVRLTATDAALQARKRGHENAYSELLLQAGASDSSIVVRRLVARAL